MVTQSLHEQAAEQRRRRAEAAAEARQRIGAANASVLPARSEPGFSAPKVEQNKDFFDHLGTAVQTALSGERTLNALLPGDPGSALLDWVDNAPIVGGALREAADIGFSPVTLATAALGPLAQGALRGGPLAARAVAGFTAPLVEGGFGARLAAETGVGVASSLASKKAQEVTGSPVAGLAAGLGAGLLATRTLGNLRNAHLATPPTGRGGITGLPEDDPVRHLFESVDNARDSLRAQRAAVRAERASRTGTVINRLQGVTDPAERSRVINQARKGAFAAAEPIKGVSADDVVALQQRIINFPGFQGGRYYNSEDRARQALNTLLAGQPPQEGDLKLLDLVFGQDFSGIIKGRGGWSATLADIANIPRAVMSSFDMSFPLRQGIMGIRRKEFWGSWKPMVKAFFNEEYARAAAQAIEESPNRLRFEQAGGHLTPLFGSKGSRWLDREEAFMSNMAEQLPLIGGLVKRSERAFVTFANKLRFDIFDNTVNHWERVAASGGRAVADAEVQRLAAWTNTITGRGNISPNSLIANTNSIFFSPRLFFSRLEVLDPRVWAKASPRLRKEMALDMAGFVGAGVTALTTLKLAGSTLGFDVEVELDPRSSEFGKGKVGQTRWDPWGGFQPIARYAAQIMTGERKTSTDQVQEYNRAVSLGRLAQSKLAPVPGFMLDALRGESFIGEDVDVQTSTGLTDAAAERLVPLFLRDLTEAVRAEGAAGGLKTAPAFFGLGVQTYTSVGQERAKFAQEDYGVPWDRLTAEEKDTLERVHAKELARADRDAKEGSFRFFSENLDEQIRSRQAEANRALDSKYLTAREFNRVMSDLSTERAVSLQAARAYAGFEDDPTGLIDRYLALKDDATIGGVVDYARLDQLQEDFVNALTDPRDKAIVKDFSRFLPDNSVEWYFEAKDTLRNAGYWTVEQDAFAKNLRAIERVAPGVRTVRELEVYARQAESRVDRARAEAVLSRINALTKREREKLRRRDRSLDEALQRVYGAQPISGRSPGFGSAFGG